MDDELVKSHSWDGKVKSSSSRRREFRGMRRTYVRRSEHGMKRNAEIEFFTKPSMDELKKNPKTARLSRWIPAFLVMLWSIGCCLPKTDPLLKGLDLKGFEQASPMVVYNKDNLFDYMNGEAEVYLPLGFQLLYSQSYRKQENGSPIIVDVYDMATPKGAQGVFQKYTQKGGSAIQSAGVSAWTDEYFVLFWRNNYFFRVWPDPAPISEEKPQLQDMINLSQAIDEAFF